MEQTIFIRKNEQTTAKHFSLYKMATKGIYYADIDPEFLREILLDQEKLKRYASFIVGMIK